MPVGKRLRFEVFKRDRFTCQYCGRTPPTVILHCDHVIPESEDGPTEINNLVTSCEACNLGKSNIPLTEVPDTVQQQMEKTREKREQVEALNALLAAERDAEDEQITKLGRLWHSLMPDGKGYVFGAARIPSIRTFLRRAPYFVIAEAMEIAAAKVYATRDTDDRRWKYFCGVCWKKIRDAEEGR